MAEGNVLDFPAQTNHRAFHDRAMASKGKPARIAVSGETTLTNIERTFVRETVNGIVNLIGCSMFISGCAEGVDSDALREANLALADDATRYLVIPGNRWHNERLVNDFTEQLASGQGGKVVVERVGDLGDASSTYMARNDRLRDVAAEGLPDERGMLLAFPRTEVEELRSGTWATIRHFNAHPELSVVIYPLSFAHELFAS